MHYRNGREAKNGDIVVQFHHSNGKIVGVGVLYDAKPGNDYCNGNVAPLPPLSGMACLIDCIHADDLAAILTEKGLGRRPEGK
jgi:hypothetical protein